MQCCEYWSYFDWFCLYFNIIVTKLDNIFYLVTATILENVSE